MVIIHVTTSCSSDSRRGPSTLGLPGSLESVTRLRWSLCSVPATSSGCGTHTFCRLSAWLRIRCMDSSTCVSRSRLPTHVVTCSIRACGVMLGSLTLRRCPESFLNNKHHTEGGHLSLARFTSLSCIVPYQTAIAHTVTGSLHPEY